MKYNFNHELLTASTDSTAVAKRLILIIEDLERKVEDKAIEEYLNDKPKTKSEFGAGDAYRVPNIDGEYNLPAQPFKGAIVVDEDDFVNHCIKRQQKEIKPADIDDEEIEIDSVPSDDEPKTEVPHGKKIKSSEIKPQEGTVEDAYLGEHFEITPDEPEEKPLTPAEQELWDYIQKNPNYTMQGACRALKITTANYYWRKRQLYLKGKPVGGTIPFASKPKDRENEK